MTGYIVRRLLWGVLLLVLVILVTFLVYFLLPSVDPAVLRAGKTPSQAVIREIRVSLGLNHSIIVQFFNYLKGIILHLNFGYSYYYNDPVGCLLYTSPSPRDRQKSRMPSSA